MVRSVSVPAVIGLCIGLSACVTQRVEHREDMLAAAGFTLVPANTPQRQASLKALPPHKFVRQLHGDTVMYVYADPTICDCLYMGDQAAYGRYRENVFLSHIAEEQQMTAEMNQNAMVWGPWEGGL